MVETVENRLGVVPFGSDEPVGNLLAYPRRIVLEFLKQLFVQENLFTSTDADGTPTQRNPFLLKYEQDGVTIAKDSRIILVDYGSEKTLKEETRPRVVVSRGGGRFSTQRLDSQQFGAFGRNDREKFAANYASSLNFRCVSRVKVESESLAAVVALSLTFFSEKIKKLSHIEHVSMPAIGETVVEKANGETEQWATAVQVDIDQTISWQLMQLNPVVLHEILVQVVL